MKSYQYLLTLLAASSLLISCGSDSEEHEQQSHAEHAHQELDGSSQEQAEHALEGMSLNSGSKWAMDDHTRSAFSAMASSFLSRDHSSMTPDDLKSAGADLQQGITGLIQGCTMTGDAHNQLHIFLTGYMAAVNSLAETGQMDDAMDIKQYLEGYNKYFE